MQRTETKTTGGVTVVYSFETEHRDLVEQLRQQLINNWTSEDGVLTVSCGPTTPEEAMWRAKVVVQQVDDALVLPILQAFEEMHGPFA